MRLVPREATRVWPLLLRAGGMSVHPGRVIIGMMACLVMLGAGRLFDTIHRALVDNPSARFDGMLIQWRFWLFGVFPTPSRAISGLSLPDFNDLQDVFRLEPASLFLIAALACVFALASGAMARMVAVDIAADADMSTRHAVRFSLARWKSLLLAHLIPIGFLIGAMLALGAFGKVLLSLNGVAIFGTALFGVAAVVGVIAMGVWFALSLGGWMLAPAVVCESTDAVDAMQRCAAYIFKRVGHTLLYLAIIVGVGLVALWIVRYIFIGGFEFAAASAQQWLSDERVAELHKSGTITDRVLTLWRWFFELIVSGWLLSYVSTGATLMYLALRRVCDDQDPRDLWMEAGRREPVMPELGEEAPAETDQPDE